MSKELLALVDRIQLRQYEKSPPKKLLYAILQKIKRKLHYGRFRSWEILVELLAAELGITKTKHIELAKEVKPQIHGFIQACRKNPWDYLGEVYTEEGLVGQGQNMTPKAIVQFMIKAVHPDPWVYEAEVFCFASLLAYIIEHEVFYHMPPHHLKPVEIPVKTQLDPCVGTGRFLLEASRMYPKAPLRLYGIEISLPLYRACLVNMAIMSNHPYYIICADTLRLDNNSQIWRLANRWNPPDMSKFYWKPPPIRADHFSLKAFVKLKKT